MKSCWEKFEKSEFKNVDIRKHFNRIVMLRYFIQKKISLIHIDHKFKKIKRTSLLCRGDIIFLPYYSFTIPLYPINFLNYFHLKSALLKLFINPRNK